MVKGVGDCRNSEFDRKEKKVKELVRGQVGGRAVPMEVQGWSTQKLSGSLFLDKTSIHVRYDT